MHGGIVRYITKLAAGFQRLGHAVTVISRDDTNPRVEQIDGITIWRVRVRQPRVFRVSAIRNVLSPWVVSSAYAKALREVHRQKAIDVIEFTNYQGEGLAHSFRKVAPHFTRVSTMGWQSNEISGKAAGRKRISAGDRWRNYLEGLAIRKSDSLITPTAAHAQLVKGCYGLERLPSDVPHGIDLPGAGIEENKVEKDVINFLFVGKIDPRKGFDVLIRSFCKVAATRPGKARLTVVGGDTQLGAGKTSYLSEQIQNIDPVVMESIEIAGWRTDEQLVEYYRACDVFVSPSRYESFGLIYLEAMQFGKPVIACDAGGVPEIVLNGTTGLLVRPGDTDQLTDAMITLIDDAEFRRRLGAAGFHRWNARFTESEACRRSIEEYRRQLALRG